MKHAFRLSRPVAAFFAFALVLCASAGTRAQTLSPTPDTLIFQVTSTTIPPVPPATPTPTPSATPTPTPTGLTTARNSFAGDMSGNGRFVVIESEGDISTERTASRNNTDGNPEIFLFDYAQRRIFQITDTKSALKNAALSPIDAVNIDVLVVNLRPVISHDGRFIAFVSNAYSDANTALSPKGFDGNVAANAAALKADGNTEVFIYEIPAVADADLSSGAEVAFVNLAANAITRVTFTPASALPRPGAANVSPFFALDNNAVALNDDATFVAFVSSAKSGMAGVSNADGNKEIVIFNRTASAFVQATTTADKPPTATNPLGTLIFNDNPSLSGTGTTLAFLSNADINSSEVAADQGNGEIHAAIFNGSSVANVRPVTKTPPERRVGFEGVSVNLLSPGRRLSRDGSRVVFESTANYAADGSLPATPLATTTGIYIANISNVSAATFALVASRPLDTQSDIGLRFPVFTGDSTRVIWTSNLNLKVDGTAVGDTDATGLNVGRNAQLFTAPVATLNQVSRLTNFGLGAFVAIQPHPADDVRRIAMSLNGELGGGNSDRFSEAFYLLVPAATSETPAPSPTPAASPAPVSFATGASDRPIAA
ncbi:MAG: PD40 domain-containing protein, partial [Rubrivivax sp.]|nr:PD40 domain-containing protein [Pyrinomonadaceae bacterium]